MLFFFFQAEDGIRDLTVTGVQTCALPILTRTFSLSETHSSLHLCDPAIHEQLDSRDVATVVGREERHGLGNLVGSTEAAEWHRGGDHLRALLASLRGDRKSVV